MSGAPNLIDNPDFEELNGTTPAGWYGFGWCKLKLGDLKFQGKNSCMTQDRKHDHSGIAQEVSHILRSGKRYEFKSFVRLHPSVEDNQTEIIGVTLQYKLSNHGDYMYKRITEINVTSNKWEMIAGRLNMPPVVSDVVLEKAVIYFSRPPPGVDFIAAEVSCKEIPSVISTCSNLLENPSFEHVNGDIPTEWQAFNDCAFCKGLTDFNEKPSCQTTKRAFAYAGFGQDVTYVLNAGYRYKVTGNVRLTPDVSSEEKHTVTVKLQLKLSNSNKFKYLLATQVDEVTSNEWISFSGRLNMPRVESGDVIVHAKLYISGPPAEVNFLVADMSLTDITPAGVKQEISAALPVPTQLVFQTSPPDGVLPNVFISYQWDIQDKVKQLREAIEAEGIACWMDIGQMGGGDALYTQIDAGIRAAKVIVSCVTHKYAMSENCQREVTLSDLLKKPVIPVLFENIPWPPMGPMAMIYAKLLYIDFCQESGVIPQNKLEELLHKIKHKIK